MDPTDSPVSAEPRVSIVRHVLPAPPGEVFDEWIDADSLKDWMCPRPARCLKVKVDPRPGGSYLFEVEDDGTLLEISGRYTIVDRPHRLAFTWTCSTWPESVESIVTVSLDAAEDGKTLMTIEHMLLPRSVVDQHHAGWTRIVQQLSAALASEVR